MSPSPGTLTRGLMAGCILLAGSPASTAGLDGDLLLIKSLLVLREQLSPFELTLTSTTKSLDFSSTTDALSALLGSGGGVFRFSRDNALLSLLSDGLPRVAERRVDAKAELETLLKAACEAFISRCRALLICASLEALLKGSVTGEVRTSPPLLQSTVQGSAGGESALATHAAAWMQEAGTLVDDLLTVSPPLLAGLRRRMGLYLGSPVTASILFRPLRDAAGGAIAAVRARAHDCAGALVTSGAASPALAAAAQSRAALDAKLVSLSLLLDASDQLALDPTSAAFGCDDILLPTAVHRLAAAPGGAVSTSPSPEGPG